MKNHARTAAGLLALALVCSAGCGGARPSKYYQLTVPGDSAHVEAADPLPVTLLVGRLTAPAMYREDQIVYTSGGEAMGTYEYQRWSEPPTEMIQEIMLRQLRSSGRFRGVYMLRSDVKGDYLLHGHLYDLKEINGNGAIAARVSLEVELRNVKTGSTVWTHYFSHDEPAGGKDVGAVVAALDKGVQAGVAEIRSGLEQYFAAHPPAPAAQ